MWDTFYYGVCYYPEHWDAKRHASDIKRIADAGFNFVRMGEGAWNTWEPEEGEFQFDLFDRVIDLCRKHKVKVVLGTPTYAAPAWVSAKYPEVLRWDFNRVPMKHGSRRNFNYTSPKYLELSDRLCTALAEHYRDEKQVIGWQLDNEFNCHMDVSYAPSDTIAFRAWLRETYKTLDRLNDAWGTKFWAQTYDAWDQIDLPHPTATYLNPSVLLDESRFISDCVVRFARRQAAILRKANGRWFITHNALFPNVDGPKLTAELDFFSHDQYPLFSREGDWPAYAWQLMQARSLSFPFGILEQQSGPGGQMQYLQRTPRPGEMRLWAMQSIAHGAGLFSYFRWRTCPYGSEQHWHGIIDADDRDNRRLAEAKSTGEELQKLPKAFFAAEPTRFAAVLRDFDNDINDRRINTYNKAGNWENVAWLAELAKAHMPADITWPDSDWRGYRLLIVPHIKIVDKNLAAKFEKFVRGGGTLVLTAQSGSKDRNCHIVEMPLPGLLAKLTGVEIEDWTTLGDGESRVASMSDGGQVMLATFVERLKAIDAETIGQWIDDDPLLAGGAAITRKRVGKGYVYYVGGYTQFSVWPVLWQVMTDLKVSPPIDAPPEVELIVRGKGSSRFVVLLNHSSTAQRVRGLPAGSRSLIGPEVGESGALLGPYDVAVVQLR